MDASHLAACLDATLSPDPRTREESSRFLLENIPKHATGLEFLLALSSGVNDANGRTPVVSEGGKLAAAVALKNGIKKRWTVDENEEDDAKEIEAPAKEQSAKVWCWKALDGTNSNQQVKNQLAEALQVIATTDLSVHERISEREVAELVPSLVNKTVK